MLLEIRALALWRGKRSILEHIDLTLRRGEIYGLIGPNGAGKSTTIAAVLGLLPRRSGAITVLGLDPAHDAKSIHARCGVLPEHGGFYDWMTAPDYLALYARLYGRVLPSAAIERQLGAVGLELRGGQAIGTFSKGMRQRLGLARALLCDPELLILDEPTNGLDPRGRREIHDLLLQQRRRGTGVLLCTHLLDDVERLCDRVGIVRAGRTIAEDDIEGLVGSGAGARSFRIRLAGPAAATARTPDYLSIVSSEQEWVVASIGEGVEPSRAWRELLESGWPISEVHAQSENLEAVYLKLTERSDA